MRYFPLSLSLLAISLAVIMPATAEDASYWLSQAASDYRNGSNSLALQDIEEYLEQNSTDAWAWSFKANLELRMKRYSDAVDSFDRLLELEPANDQVYNDRALILSGGLRRDQEALESLEKALEINPRNANAWYNKGVILEKMERMDEARDAFEKATTLDATLDKAWFRQGQLLAENGSYNESLRSLDRAIELNSENADAWDIKGLVLMKMNKAQEALACFEKAIALMPSRKDFGEHKNDALSSMGVETDKKIEFAGSGPAAGNLSELNG